jgi:hypothetical protein
VEDQAAQWERQAEQVLQAARSAGLRDVCAPLLLPPGWSPEVGMASFRWAAAVRRSRGFGVHWRRWARGPMDSAQERKRVMDALDEGGATLSVEGVRGADTGSCLVPFADLLNHDYPPNADWSFNTAGTSTSTSRAVATECLRFKFPCEWILRRLVPAQVTTSLSPTARWQRARHCSTPTDTAQRPSTSSSGMDLRPRTPQWVSCSCRRRCCRQTWRSPRRWVGQPVVGSGLLAAQRTVKTTAVGCSTPPCVCCAVGRAQQRLLTTATRCCPAGLAIGPLRRPAKRGERGRPSFSQREAGVQAAGAGAARRGGRASVVRAGVRRMGGAAARDTHEPLAAAPDRRGSRRTVRPPGSGGSAGTRAQVPGRRRVQARAVHGHLGDVCGVQGGGCRTDGRREHEHRRRVQKPARRGAGRTGLLEDTAARRLLTALAVSSVVRRSSRQIAALLATCNMLIGAFLTCRGAPRGTGV